MTSPRRLSAVPPATDSGRTGTVRTLAPSLDDAGLVHAARRGDQAAKGALFDRHATRVRRVLLRVLGPDRDLSDLLQEVFVMALRDLDNLSDPGALGGWLSGIAVHVARHELRRRSRWRWIRFVADDEVPEVPDPGADTDARAEVRAVYRALGALPTDERIAFALRFLDGMELTEVARHCDVSLATIKRRLARAEASFRDEIARREPALVERLAKLEGRL